MPLVFAGVCSHAPGITGRADQADPAVRNAFYDAFGTMRASLEAARPEAVVVVAAEHFANFFMDNMPSLALGMADRYDGPIEDPAWLGIDRVQLPGDRDLSQRFITEVMQGSDVAYAEEWRFDHGIMVPLHFLTPRYDLPVIPANINCQGPPLLPLHRAWAFGESLRAAADALPERIALVGTGGISHWPATPTPGRSTSPGTVTSSTAGPPTTGTGSWTTTTSPSTPRPGRAASRSAPSSPSAPPPAAPGAPSTSTPRSRSSPSAAPSPPTPWPVVDDQLSGVVAARTSVAVRP